MIVQRTEIITDGSLRELVAHGTEDFPFEFDYEDIHAYDIGKINWHWHDEFEFLQVVKGTVYCLIGSLRFPLYQGDGIFINTGMIHSMEAPKEGIIFSFLFTSELIGSGKSILYKKYMKDFFRSKLSHTVLRRKEPWQEQILEEMNRILRICMDQAEPDELEIHIIVCSLWQQLYRHRSTIETMEMSGVTLQSQARLRQMMQYIEEHYNEKITLQEIAESANISKSEALRCFRHGMQQSPIDSLNRFRLRRAKELLEKTDLSVLEIAFGVGFENCSYFDRLFKRHFGMTPRAFRKSL